MRCLFCKQNSDESKSVEHIVPESIGNIKQILPPGVVCDACNNYFAREVEKPFLESPEILALRFHQAVPSKKGRIPPLQGRLDSGAPVIAHRDIKGDSFGSLSVDEGTAEQLLKSEKGTLILPAGGELTANPFVSRFLAKAALEVMAQRLLKSPEGLAYLVDEPQLDPVRNHARRGQPREWPYHSRRIYDANQSLRGKTGSALQIVHEYDFLQTEKGEMYFILALFGLELALNVGGPLIEGYTSWLEQHNQASPLYWGKNDGMFPEDNS
jgi:hypothetical protein